MIHELKSKKDYPPTSTQLLLYTKNHGVLVGFYDPSTIELCGGCGFFKIFKDKMFGYDVYPHDFYACEGLTDVYAWSEIPEAKISNKEFRKWRRDEEISQGLIAFYVGCNKTTISRWEKGQINISLELYERIMKFYKENKDYDSDERSN